MRLGENPRPILHNYNYYIKIEGLENLFSQLLLFVGAQMKNDFFLSELNWKSSNLSWSSLFFPVHSLFTHCWITPKHQHCVYSCKYFLWPTAAFTSSPSESIKRTDVERQAKISQRTFSGFQRATDEFELRLRRKTGITWIEQRLFWYFSSTAHWIQTPPYDGGERARAQENVEIL